MEHCLGNHDVWGRWHNALQSDPRGGLAKRWALDELGLERRYRSFDRGGWHFVVLDSIFLQGGSYQARLDNDQFDWLAADLQAGPPTTPVLVVSHIPILGACVFFDGDNVADGRWVVPGAWMHLDAVRLRDLFRRHPNIRLCLSGHTHLRDRVDYEGVTYLCNGAVCGAWWRGPYGGCPAGYGLIDLYPDGDFDHQYVRYQ
jgi:3',5'-cyclic AMP phosphodiesterase CpdA